MSVYVYSSYVDWLNPFKESYRLCLWDQETEKEANAQEKAVEPQ
jgi:hypothetical protein